jgi:hypothetical protein
MMNSKLALSRRCVLRVLASIASVFALEGCASMRQFTFFGVS